MIHRCFDFRLEFGACIWREFRWNFWSRHFWIDGPCGGFSCFREALIAFVAGREEVAGQGLERLET